MMKELKKRVDTDYSNDIIALWHDESHLNKFFSENPDRVNALSPDYAYPECFPQYPYDRKIIHLAKIILNIKHDRSKCMAIAHILYC